MSHTTPAAASTGPAPWKSIFQSHIDKMPTPEFVLASLHKASPSPITQSNSSNNKAQKPPTPYLPRARYCVYRGTWGTLPENKHNTADRNPAVYESDMPTFTTDVRMDKVGELFGSGAGHAEKDEQVQGSGGGGPVEAVFWVKEAMTQWRIAGEGFIVAEDIEGEGGEEKKESSGVRTVKSEVGKRMRISGEGKDKEKEWSWVREIRGHFGNLSPGMRGSFRNPPPGQATSEPYDKEKLSLGQNLEDLDDALARKNFRVGIIVPDMVEQLDMNSPETSRRWRYTYDAESGKWNTEELWP